MKKSSTAAAASKRNVDQRLTIGLDLGDRLSLYCVVDEAGEVISEQKLSTTPKAMKEAFAAMSRSRIALETGMHSPWVSRLLSELGHEVIVAHARNVASDHRTRASHRSRTILAAISRIEALRNRFTLPDKLF